MKKLLILPLLLSAMLLHGQNPGDTSRFRVGIFGGYYISGDAAARYYNGQDNNRLREFLYHPQMRPRIEESLGNYSFELAEYARDMAYKNSFALEFSAAISFGNQWYISARLHNVKLDATGIFTLKVDRPNPTGPPNELEQAAISGKETRSHLDIGFGKRFWLEDNFYLLGELGFDMNFVKAEENKINIAGKTYSLPMYTDRLNPQATPGNTFGMGVYAMAGIGYQLPGHYGIWAKLTYFQTNIDVNRMVKENTAIVIPGIGFTRSF